MSKQNLDDYLKASKLAAKVLSEAKLDNIPIYKPININLDDVVNPSWEQVELMKNFIKQSEEHIKLLHRQNELLEKRSFDAQNEARKSMRREIISYIIAFVMFVITLVSVLI